MVNQEGAKRRGESRLQGWFLLLQTVSNFAKKIVAWFKLWTQFLHTPHKKLRMRRIIPSAKGHALRVSLVYP